MSHGFESVGLAHLVHHKAPTNLLRSWRNRHGPGEQISVSQAFQELFGLERFQDAEWLLLELTPLKIVHTWLARAIEDLASILPEEYQEHAGTILKAFIDHGPVPDEVMMAWETSNPITTPQGAMAAYAYGVAAQHHPLESSSYHQRLYYRRLYAALLSAYATPTTDGRREILGKAAPVLSA